MSATLSSPVKHDEALMPILFHPMISLVAWERRLNGHHYLSSDIKTLQSGNINGVVVNAN